MDNFEWRTKARAVAYTEQFLFAIAFPASIVFALIDANNATNGVEASTERDKMIEEVVINIFGGRDGMLLYILLKEEVIVLLVVIGLWATLKLLRSTTLKIGDLKQVVQLAQSWRNVNLVFLLILIIDLFLFQSYVTLGIELALVAMLLIFLQVVTAYLNEVRAVMNHTPVNSSSDI